jgi:hypothetical protein
MKTIFKFCFGINFSCKTLSRFSFFSFFFFSFVITYAQEAHYDAYYLNGGGGINRSTSSEIGYGIRVHAGGSNENIFFHLDVNSAPDITIRRPVNGSKYPLLVSMDSKFRIVGAETLQFAAGYKGVANGDAYPDMTITSNGYVGIGTTTDPSDRLTVANGNICLWDNSFLYKKTMGDGTTATFNIRQGTVGNQVWLGNQTNHKLTIGTNSRGMMDFIPNSGTNEDYVIIYKGTTVDVSKISTTNKQRYSLFVMGGILSEDFAIGPQSSWADHVFKKDYRIPNLKEVENYINLNHKLPDIPSASEIQESGYTLHDMNVKLLQKIEELTLYSIEQSKKIEQMEKVMESLKDKINQ